MQADWASPGAVQAHLTPRPSGENTLDLTGFDFAPYISRQRPESLLESKGQPQVMEARKYNYSVHSKTEVIYMARFFLKCG